MSSAAVMIGALRINAVNFANSVELNGSTMSAFYSKDGWMTCYFTAFSTVFQSYQAVGWMIMKGCVQRSPVYAWKDLCLKRGWNP